MSSVFFMLCESRHDSFNRPRFRFQCDWPVGAIAENIPPHSLSERLSTIGRQGFHECANGAALTPRIGLPQLVKAGNATGHR
jgi:hypothetical protein